MGQVEDRSNLRRRFCGIGAQGQAIRRFLPALACAALSFFLVGSTFYQAPEPLFFDQDVAWKHLLWQVALGPRVPGTDGHTQCRKQLADAMAAYCDNVRQQQFSHDWSVTKKPVTMYNIVGEQNWQNAKVHVVLMAHWDTRPYADQEANEALRVKPIPGANDGASGVAVLLELMRVMKHHPNPDLGILYVLDDGEDLGPDLNEMFLGAEHFAKTMPNPRPDYGILLDMIGDKELDIPVEPNSYRLAKPLIQAFYRHAQAIHMDDTFLPEYGPVIEDDHLAINKAGVPMIDLIDFTYDAWHTVRDKPDQCSAESLGKVGRMLESWLTKKPLFVYPTGPRE